MSQDSDWSPKVMFELHQLATARMVLMGCRGVEAWSDLSLSTTPDRQVTFKGTAYFKNLDAFKIERPQHHHTVLDVGQGSKGRRGVEIRPPGRWAAAKPVKLAPDELAKRVAKARVEWKAGAALCQPDRIGQGRHIVHTAGRAGQRRGVQEGGRWHAAHQDRWQEVLGRRRCPGGR